MKRKLKIRNSKLEIPARGGRGYTLIELLSVIAIFAIVGAIVVSIMAFTLRGSKKSDLTESVRESGNAALSQMVRVIRYTQSIDSPVSCAPSSTTSGITFTSMAGVQTALVCDATAKTITSNGVSVLDTTSVLVQSCSFTCRQPTNDDIPSVTIQFTLKSNNTTSFFENSVTLPFQTTVTLRNAVNKK